MKVENMMKYIVFGIAFILSVACSNEVEQENNHFFLTEDLSSDSDILVQLTDSLEKDPNNIHLWIQKGNICKDRLNFSCALDAGAKAFVIDSTNIEARQLYAWSLINKPNAPVTDVELAKRHFQYVLSLQPRDPKTLVDLANTYSLTGDFRTAIKYINDALRIDEYYRDGYVLKGSIYKTLENYDLALSSYQTALQIDPNFFIGHLNTGWLLTEMENHTLALEYYRSAVDLLPENINALYGVAKSLQDLERYDEALAEYRVLLEIEPTFYIPYFNQGYIKQYYQHELDSAIYYYEQLLRINPEYIGAWYQLGEVYFTQKKYTSAADCYVKALEIDEDFTPARTAAERLRHVKIE